MTEIYRILDLLSGETAHFLIPAPFKLGLTWYTNSPKKMGTLLCTVVWLTLEVSSWSLHWTWFDKMPSHKFKFKYQYSLKKV